MTLPIIHDVNNHCWHLLIHGIYYELPMTLPIIHEYSGLRLYLAVFGLVMQT
jgi:hypothetical protein